MIRKTKTIRQHLNAKGQWTTTVVESEVTDNRPIPVCPAQVYKNAMEIRSEDKRKWNRQKLRFIAWIAIGLVALAILGKIVGP